MIHIFFTKVLTSWSNVVFDQYSAELPTPLVNQVMEKNLWKDRQLSLAGKLLLKRMIEKCMPVEKLDLEMLVYNNFGKPYFNGHTNFQFNIAHSGDIVICAGSATDEIGVDIELVKPIATTDFNDYFTANEWRLINSCPDRNAAFFSAWTRKEAFMKATGMGVHMPLDQIDTLQPFAEFNNRRFYSYQVAIADDYQCHISVTAARFEFELKEWNF